MHAYICIPQDTIRAHGTQEALQAVQQGLEHWSVHAVPCLSARPFHWGDRERNRHIRFRVADRRRSAHTRAQEAGGVGSSGAGLVNTMQEDGPLGFPLADEGGDEQQGVCWEWSGALRVDTPGSFPMRIPSDGHMHGGADICNCKAQVRVVGGATYVVVEEESEAHPSCLLVNALPPPWEIQARLSACT